MLLTALAAIAAILSVLLTPIAGAEPNSDFTSVTGDEYNSQWTASMTGPQPYNGVRPDLAVPIAMDDGTILKADIFHPTRDGVQATERTPVVLQLQGYGKLVVNTASVLLKIPGVEQTVLPFISSLNLPGSGLDGITDVTRQLDSGVLQTAAGDLSLVNAGYTYVHVDIRGTGTSEGKWDTFGERERKDAMAIADWIVAQPWSNGNIGLTGASFTGITAIAALTTGHPAFKASFLTVPSYDIKEDIAATGGATGIAFLLPWLLAVSAAKFIPDLEAIAAGKWNNEQQLQWLNDRLADPTVLVDVVAGLYGASSFEQLPPKVREFLDPDSAVRLAIGPQADKISAATFTVSANSDIFATGQMRSYAAQPGSLARKKLIYGDGFHTGGGVADFG